MPDLRLAEVGPPPTENARTGTQSTKIPTQTGRLAALQGKPRPQAPFGPQGEIFRRSSTEAFWELGACARVNTRRRDVSR